MIYDQSLFWSRGRSPMSTSKKCTARDLIMRGGRGGGSLPRRRHEAAIFHAPSDSASAKQGTAQQVGNGNGNVTACMAESESHRCRS